MLLKNKHIILIMVIVTFTLTACQKLAKQDESSSPTQGGTLYWGTINKPTIINPILTTHSVSMSLMDLIFNRLVRINAEGEIEPDLAKSWDVSQDGLVYTFHLREGVYFHDGVECTAEDVAYTYKLLVDPKNKSPFRSHFSLINKYEAVGPYTFRITLEKSFPRLLHKLVREILPKHIVEGKNLKRSQFNYYPIGTGPFQFKSWNRETDEIELVANERYFEGRPHLDKIVVKTYWDISSLWSALMRHEVDLALYINREDFLIARRDESFKTYTIPWKMYSAIVYNTKDKILADKMVRLAIAHGIDRQKIMAITEMDGIESTGPFHPNSIGFNRSVSPLKYNPVKAKNTLRQRGWIDHDGDGIRDKNGIDLEIKVLVDTQSDFYKTMVMSMRQQLAEIGIKMIVQLYEDEKELTKEYLNKNKPQAWLRFLVGHGLDQFSEYEVGASWYSLSSEFGQLWPYKNDRVDELFERSRITDNQEVVVKSYRDIHKIIFEDQPACFLFFPVSYHAISSRIENEEGLFSSSHMPAYTIKDWYIAN